MSSASTNHAHQVSEMQNFWEINRYRLAVKRIDDGYKRCSDLTSFLQDRAECEKTFARQLRSCSRRWTEILQPDRGVEYGTTLNAWAAFLVETDRTADMHSRIAERLREVVEHVKAWQKNNYHRGVISNKTVKEFDDEFKKAQKPWAKAHNRMNKAKKDYHSAYKTLIQADAQKQMLSTKVAEITDHENNATGLSSTTTTTSTNSSHYLDLKKAIERFDKCTKELETSEQKYKNSLEELERIMPNYLEQMTIVFEKTQAFERERLRFFKEVFKGLHDSLDVSKSNELNGIYDELAVCIEESDADADTEWWAKTYGAKMPLKKPEFIDYDKITSERINNNNPTAPMAPSSPPKQLHIGFPKPMTEQPKRVNNSSTSNTNMINCSDIVYPDANNPFSSDTGNDIGNGITVKALYNYVAQEGDELSLKAGMEFLMIEERDEQGWCKGRIGTKEGFYPASYAIPQ